MKPAFEIRTSPIHGSGLFATRLFEVGERIAHVAGPIIQDATELAQENPNWIGIAPNTWIDPDPPFSSINHSCSPSCALRERGWLVARRVIASGDELTVDYSSTEADPAWNMHCACGEAACRGILSAIHIAFPIELPDAPEEMVAFWLDVRKSQL